MKRTLFKLGLLLVAGAIINVAVAWLIALTVDLHKLGTNEAFAFGSGPDYHDWQVLRNENLRIARVTSFWTCSGAIEEADKHSSPVSPSALNFEWARQAGPHFWPKAKSYHFALAWECGWPTRSTGGVR